MRLIIDGVERFSFFMHLLAGILLVFMMLVTMADILTRLLFNVSNHSIDITFYGGIEIVSYTLLYAILFSLPYSVSHGQVMVDLFTERMSERRKEFLGGFYTIGFGLLGTGMCFGLYEAAYRVAETGETSQDLLIPMSYVYGVAAFAAGILALRGFTVAFEQMHSAWRKSS